MDSKKIPRTATKTSTFKKLAIFKFVYTPELTRNQNLHIQANSIKTTTIRVQELVKVFYQMKLQQNRNMGGDVYSVTTNIGVMNAQHILISSQENRRYEIDVYDA